MFPALSNLFLPITVKFIFITNTPPDALIFDKHIQNTINEYVQMLWGDNGKKNKNKNKKELFYPLRASFQQDATITGENGFTTDTNVVNAIFDVAYRGRFYTAISQQDTTDEAQWSSKRACIFSILECQLRLSQKDIQESENRNIKRFSGIYILSESFATKMSLQVKDICNHVRDFVLPDQKNCLFIIEEKLNMSIFDNLCEKPNTHTIIYFPDVFGRHGSELMKLKCPKFLMQFNTVSGLVITSIPETPTKETETPTKEKSLRRYLQSCGKKIGFKNLKDLTFKSINLENASPSSNVIVPKFTYLQYISIKKCNFFPVLGASVSSIEVEMSKYLVLSSAVDHLVPLTYQVLQTCPKVETIKVQEIHVGTKRVCFKLNRPSIETNCHCDYETVKYLVDTELSKGLAEANCDLADFKTINDENERKMFLKYLALSLKLNDDNLVDVYAARHKDKCSEDSDIVFVCYMKVNFDLSKEHANGIDYKGFSTYYRSHDLVSSESAKAEDSISIDKWKEVDKLTLTNIGSVIKACTDSLMEKHSNLEAISISLGKAKNEMLDTSSGPCIVLFVRLKSFIPYNEKEFPAELCIPDCQDIKFTVDVREGFYTPVAECRREHIPTGRLVMGCSIGCVEYEYSASLGPFVEWKTDNGDHKIGFLTVCHVFCLPGETSNYNKLPDVIQPASMDESDDFYDVQSGEPLQENKCGRVAAVEFDEAVDAAVVEITVPSRLPNTGAFITCNRGQLRDAELNTRPKYVNGSSAHLDQCEHMKVIKVGKKTQLTAGQILHNNGVVRITSRPYDCTCPQKGNRTIRQTMKDQIEVRGYHGKSAFCDIGDSGAGVFLVSTDESLSCVGILIGKIGDGNMAMVTPINQVLDKLSSKLKLLRLKSFLPETS